MTFHVLIECPAFDNFREEFKIKGNLKNIVVEFYYLFQFLKVTEF